MDVNIANSINALKEKKANQLNDLKQHLEVVGESLKPINILKSTATDVIGLVKSERNILNHIIDIGITTVTKKATSLLGNNIFSKMFGKLIKR